MKKERPYLSSCSAAIGVWVVGALQIRAGESESETQDTVLTNPVWKQSGMAGLSNRGKAQVRLPNRQYIGNLSGPVSQSVSG